MKNLPKKKKNFQNQCSALLYYLNELHKLMLFQTHIKHSFPSTITNSITNGNIEQYKRGNTHYDVKSQQAMLPTRVCFCIYINEIRDGTGSACPEPQDECGSMIR